MTNALAAIDVVVRDGSTVCLRRAEEGDLQALLEFLGSLSPESLYYRFLGLPSLTAARVRALTAADGRTAARIRRAARGITVRTGTTRTPVRLLVALLGRAGWHGRRSRAGRGSAVRRPARATDRRRSSRYLP